MRLIKFNIFSLNLSMIIVAFTSGCSGESDVALPELNPSRKTTAHKIPNFADMQDVKSKKKAFFSFLAPMAKEENTLILEKRKALLNLEKKQKQHLEFSSHEKKWLTSLAKRYKIKASLGTAKFWTLFKKRVDAIPLSLLLSQAALESSWGTSRFSQKANNLFGHWCFKKGCGLVPKRRNSGAAHEVKKFKTVNNAISAYMLNLNTHKVYLKLRNARETLRQKGKPLTGIALAVGLEKYSERGLSYVHELQSMIASNKLSAYDLNNESI